MISLLFDIPSDVYNTIFCEWLEAIDWNFIDTALCNRRLRIDLLQQLSTMEVMDYGMGKNSLWNWFQLRRMGVVHVFLTRTFLKSSFNQFETIRSILVHDEGNDKVALTKALNLCHNLFTLIWHTKEIRGKFCNGALFNLRFLIIGCQREKDCEKILKAIKSRCRKLLKWQMTSSTVQPELYETVVEIIRLNPSLQSIKTFGSGMVLGKIKEYCPDIEDISLKGRVEDFGESEIVEMINSRTNLSMTIVMDPESIWNIEFEQNDRAKQLRVSSLRISHHQLYSIAGLTSIETDEAHIDNVLQAILDHSGATLNRVKVGSPNKWEKGIPVNEAALLNICSRCINLTDLSINISCLDEELVDVFTRCQHLKLNRLSILAMYAMSMSTVLVLLDLFQSLTECYFTCVLRNTSLIHDYMNYLRQNERIVICELFLTDGFLYYRGGIFSGSNVEEFLNDEELAANPFDVVEHSDSDYIDEDS